MDIYIPNTAFFVSFEVRPFDFLNFTEILGTCRWLTTVFGFNLMAE